MFTLLQLSSLLVISAAGPELRAAATKAAACDLSEARTTLLRRATIAPSDGTVNDVLPRLFAPEGFLLAPGPLTTRGPANVRRVLERDSLNATSRLRATTIGGAVSADGTDGFTYGYFDTFRANGDSLNGWYHAYWRRGTSGSWNVLALVRRRRPPGETTPVQQLPPIKNTRCVEPRRDLDTTAVLKEIMAADIAFSDSAAFGVGVAFGAFAADDAVKSGKAAAFVYGKEAIVQLYDPAPPQGLEWQPEIGTAARSGDFGYTVGSAGPRVVEANAPPRDPAAAGHYFTIWRRGPDGRWRYIID